MIQHPDSNSPERLIFIRDPNHLSLAAKYQRSSDHFVTANIFAYQLLSKDRAVNGTWDYLSGEVRRQILSEAATLKDNWYLELGDCLTYRGINMGEAIKFPFFHFLWEALASASVAEQLCKLNLPAEICLSEISEVPTKYSLAVRSDVPEAIFAYYANRFGVTLRFAGKPKERIKNKARQFMSRSLPGPVRRIGREMPGWFSDKRRDSSAHEFRDLNEALFWLGETKSKYKAVGASAYQSLLMLVPIAAHLEQTGEWSTLLLHTGHDLDFGSMMTDRRMSDFMIDDHSRSFKYLEVFKTSKPHSKVHQEFLRHAWRRFSQWQINYRGTYPQIFSNRYLEFQFRYLLIELMGELCRVVDTAYDIFQQARPDVLLVGNVSEKDLTVAAVARAMGLPSVLVPHNFGWASPEDYEYPVDYIAVQNEGTARFMENLVGPRQLLVAGDLKRSLARPVHVEPEPSRKTSNTTILVLSGGFMPGVFQNCNQGAFYSSLQSLLKHANKRTDWKIIFRMHPRLESFELIKSLVHKTKGFTERRIILETSALAEDLIPQVDVVLMLDYRSSPAIAAWRHGVPVICWSSSPLLYSLNDMFQEDWFPQVTNSLEMEQTIDRFMSDKEWHQSWVARGHDLANEYFSAPELPESIFADMLTEICQKGFDETKVGSGD